MKLFGNKNANENYLYIFRVTRCRNEKQRIIFFIASIFLSTLQSYSSLSPANPNFHRVFDYRTESTDLRVVNDKKNYTPGFKIAALLHYKSMRSAFLMQARIPTALLSSLSMAIRYSPFISRLRFNEKKKKSIDDEKRRKNPSMTRNERKTSRK